jgi:hypothetical protein
MSLRQPLLSTNASALLRAASGASSSVGLILVQAEYLRKESFQVEKVWVVISGG